MGSEKQQTPYSPPPPVYRARVCVSVCVSLGGDMMMLGKPRDPGWEQIHLTTLNPVHETMGQYLKSHIINKELCQTQHTASQWEIRQVLVQQKQPKRREIFFFCNPLGFIFRVRWSALDKSVHLSGDQQMSPSCTDTLCWI